MSELDLLRWLRERVPGLEDDVAMLPPLIGDGAWIITTDHQIPGVHLPEDAAPEIVGERLLRVGLSDIAAGGALPRYAFANVAAPADYPLQDFFRGLLRACEEFGVELKGGDTSGAPAPVLSLTLLGELPEGGRTPARGNAEPGDRLWLSGTVGESRLGRRLLELGASADDLSPARLDPALHTAATAAIRRHLQPEPHLEIGHWLASQPRAAAIDVSDGLALDLHRICEASGVGAVLDADRLPFASNHAVLANALGLDPLKPALAGGEDYVLLLGLPTDVDPPTRFDATEVGSVNAEDGVLLHREGDVEGVPALGWNHLQSR